MSSHHPSPPEYAFYSLQPSLDLFVNPRRGVLESCTSLNELVDIITTNHNLIKGEDETLISNHLPALRSAVVDLGGEQDVFDFENPNGLYQRIVSSASQLRRHFPTLHIPTLSRKSGNCSVHLRPAQIACILSHALLGNVSRLPLLETNDPSIWTRTVPHYGSLSWHLVYSSETIVARERVKGLLFYLRDATMSLQRSSDRRGEISFRRIALDKTFDLRRTLATCDDSVIAPVQFVHRGIEVQNKRSSALVDFANEDLHVGAIWPSATQEEILFSTYPECLVGMLFCETMDVHEAIRIDNVRPYCTTEGFQHTFRVTGPALNEQGTSIIAMDASTADSDTPISDQLVGPKKLDQDLLKAIAGFSGMRGKQIATGHWGCGAFGGNKYCKFLIQLIAASIRGTSLLYCLVGADSDTVESNLASIYSDIVQNGWNVSSIYEAMGEFRGPETDDAVRNFLMNRFKQ